MTLNITPAISEAEWQAQVVDLAHIYGWRHLHVRKSVGRGRKWVTATNVIGWPDLFLWHEGQHRTMAVELKSQGGELSREQRLVLRSLEFAGVEVHVWRPSDLERARTALDFSAAGATHSESPRAVLQRRHLCERSRHG